MLVLEKKTRSENLVFDEYHLKTTTRNKLNSVAQKK